MSLPEPLEKLVALFEKFPGIGEKSARRMAFFVLHQSQTYAQELAAALVDLRSRLAPCSACGNMTDTDPCSLCRDSMRDRKTLCVVETAEDLISIEQAGIYFGLYFVLGGRVSPLDGEELSVERLDALLSRVKSLSVEEVIVATNPRVEGDLTYYSVLDALKDFEGKITRLSYGLPVGGSIGFADRVTLHAALESRREASKNGNPQKGR
jgi:recombination protein RecR